MLIMIPIISTVIILILAGLLHIARVSISVFKSIIFTVAAFALIFIITIFSSSIKCNYKINKALELLEVSKNISIYINTKEVSLDYLKENKNNIKSYTVNNKDNIITFYTR